MIDPQRRTAPSRLSQVGLPFLGVVLAIGAWWGYVELRNVQPFIVPSPPAVVDAFREFPGYLMRMTWVTLAEVLIGFGLSIAVGVAIGFVLAWSPVLKQMFYPLLVGLNAIPKLAVAPLLIVWFGFEQKPKVVMVLLLCFFPIVISTAFGLTSTPVELVEYARSLDTAAWRVFLKVRLPYAAPQVFIGLKVAITLAVIGATIGEMLGGSAGLGYVIQSAGAIGNTALAFVGIALLALLGAALYFVIAAVERLALPWAQEITATAV